MTGTLHSLNKENVLSAAHANNGLYIWARSQKGVEPSAPKRCAVLDRVDLDLVPDSPGIYVFKDASGTSIYVGKAKSLRNRLATYFQCPTGANHKTASMLEEAETVEWTVASSEAEAILLEYNLIQEHRPRYNIRLKDDKSFPYLVVSASEEWPRVFVGRGRPKKGFRYLGPFARAHAVRETLDLLRKAFPIRTCTNVQFKEHQMLGRPCLYYDIKLCAGPCIGAIDADEYRALVAGFCKAVIGGHRKIAAELKRLMWEAADAEQYEKAALYRNRLEALEKVAERQQVLTAKSPSFDVVGIARDELRGRVEVFRVRNGALRARHGYLVDIEREVSDEELMGEVLTELYGSAVIKSIPLSDGVASGSPARNRSADVQEMSEGLDGRDSYADGTRLPGEVPSEIVVSVLPEGKDSLEEFLGQMTGSGVSIKTPRGKGRRDLMELVLANAKEAFQRFKLERAADHNARSRALLELQQALELNEPPLRIECFDISNTGATEVVGSMVVFEDALPRPAAYRKFKIKQVPGQDDFASMKEVLSRRLARLDKPGESSQKASRYRPGLLLIDGGPGQLRAALGAMQESGVSDIPVAALAKRFEEVYLPGRAEPVVIDRRSEALFLLQRIRDEAHRVAISYHRRRRGERVKKSILEEVPGLGPKRARKILAVFGSLESLVGADPEEVAKRASIPLGVAREVVLRIQGRPVDTLEADDDSESLEFLEKHERTDRNEHRDRNRNPE